ncbi:MULTISPECIES: MFS transporter [Microbacterium]|uniref:NarK/NasA family nitrate transporter n=1 Tax=Microbacterium wangchenii TaxID=2541726 RepID=A0ABX5SRS6_9MICO|nr:MULTISPECIES: MFS transporter [Microbacterium]MCK6065402.1 MFS transporter [Microbacterium sp. EYE_512]QBR88841.1 NarK/NasA family nitrate transporter [Microbacterium wangchenii]TXK20566.1 NarK/NasA family nitrate transporter [Microbacterium wangchenii]
MTTRNARRAVTGPLAGRGRNLALALVSFAVTFWAWNIIGPIGVSYADDLDLTPTQLSMAIATPVLVGSAGRIVTGALTDRFGGRIMFSVLTAVSAIPVILVMWAGEAGSYPLLLLFGFILGIAGTTFAVGIPFVNAWYDPSKRGFATGLFGAGMGGTALSAFFTPRLVTSLGYVWTHIAIAAALLVVAAVVWFGMRDSPSWHPNRDRVLPKLEEAARLTVTWQMAFLYAVTFGGFVAFSTYLPTYLREVYGYDLAEAGTRTAGFAVAAVIARPVGGWLSDRFGPAVITGVSLAGAAVMAVVISLQPPPELLAGASFIAMAISLGLGTGSVFAWVAQRAPAANVGSVTGIVGAAGGFGGFFPPLVMGATYDPETHRYTVGLLLLCATAAIAFVFTIYLARRRAPVPQARAGSGRR